MLFHTQSYLEEIHRSTHLLLKLFQKESKGQMVVIIVLCNPSCLSAFRSWTDPNQAKPNNQYLMIDVTGNPATEDWFDLR